MMDSSNQQKLNKPRHLRKLIIGWAAAIVISLLGIVNVIGVCADPLALTLCVDGKPICQVADRGVVGDAIVGISEKLASCGIEFSADEDITYKLSLSSGKTVSDPTECMDMIYSALVNGCKRVYTVAINGEKTVSCSTYSEAEEAIVLFQKYLTDKLLSENENAESIQISADISIINTIGYDSHVLSSSEAFEMLKAMSSGGVDSKITLSTDNIPSEDKESDSTVTGDTSSGFEDIKIVEVNATIEYYTVTYERYSEIVKFETEYIEDPEMYEGDVKIIREGENGISENLYKICYADGEEVLRELMESNVISEATTCIIAFGTKDAPTPEPTGAFDWPLKDKFTFTSFFGEYRDQFDKQYKYHYGIDLAAPCGTPIYAADGGTVITVDNTSSYGKRVIIQHEDGVISIYAHMNAFDVKEGDQVCKGDLIGRVGATGAASGYHLHFEVRIDGKIVNPLDYLPATFIKRALIES